MKALFSVLCFCLAGISSAHAGEIHVNAPPPYADRVAELLQEADSTKVGHGLLQEIRAARHTVTIQHAANALLPAGRTLLPMSTSLSNGVGADALLEMHFGIPASGSHEVLSCSGGRIAFTALMNFVHELRHARDGVTGQFYGHRSERDAVESENQLRTELGIAEQRCLSDDEDHSWQIWFGPAPTDRTRP